MLYTILKNNIFIINLINLFLFPYICKICLQNNDLKKKKNKTNYHRGKNTYVALQKEIINDNCDIVYKIYMM